MRRYAECRHAECRGALFYSLRYVYMSDFVYQLILTVQRSHIDYISPLQNWARK